MYRCVLNMCGKDDNPIDPHAIAIRHAKERKCNKHKKTNKSDSFIFMSIINDSSKGLFGYM